MMTTSNRDRLNALRPHMEAARKVASNMVGDQDADDVVQDAILAICGKVDRDGIDEEINWLAILLTYTRWAGLDWLKQRREIQEHEISAEDLSLPRLGYDPGTDLSLGDAGPAATSGEALATLASVQHRTTPAWPTAIEYTTPEDNVTAAELRDLIREIAVARHGARDYAIFLAVVMDGKSQEEVARTHDITQSAVSRIVMHVRTTLAGELANLGYNVA